MQCLRAAGSLFFFPQYTLSMWTSYFGRLGGIQRSPELCPISIALWTPRWADGVQRFADLAPTQSMVGGQALGEYRPRYEAILAKLDPDDVLGRLEEMAQGREPVLLCFEKPPFTAGHFCHRRMAAEWLESHMGQAVPEWQPARHEGDHQLNLSMEAR